MKKYKIPENPFPLTGYYGEKYFCDREREMSELEDHFKNGRNVVLYGWRRLGKTVLIKRIMEFLEESGKTEALYIDLLTTQSMDEAVRTITLAVYNKYGRTKSGLSAAMERMFS